MGIYLNSKAPFENYRSIVSDPYFVDKTALISELVPAIGKEQRFFIQVGTAETVCPEEADMPQLFIDMTMKYVHMLLEKGVPYSDICLKRDAGGEHCEKVWRKYMQEFFEFFTRMP